MDQSIHIFIRNKDVFQKSASWPLTTNEALGIVVFFKNKAQMAHTVNRFPSSLSQ